MRSSSSMAWNISSDTRSVTLRPDFDDLVVALAVGDGAVLILAFNRHHFLFGVPHQAGLFAGTTMSSMPIEMPARVAYRKPRFLTSSSICTVICRPNFR